MEKEVALKATLFVNNNKTKATRSVAMRSTAGNPVPTVKKSRRKRRFGEKVLYFYFRHVWFLFHRDVASGLCATLVRSRSALPEVHAHRHVVLERRWRECDCELVVENDCGPLPLIPRWPILIRRGDYEGVFEASHGDVN